MCLPWGIAANFIAAVCGGTDNPPTTAELTGTIQGRTLFTGDPDRYVPVPFPRDERFRFCSNLLQPVVPENVLLNRETHPITLRNAVVWIRARFDPEKSPIPTQPVLLEQRDCRFVPHVVALRAGQTLRIVNRDPDLLNVHMLPLVNKEVNYSIPHQGASRDFTFVSDRPFPIKQNVHPWMIAWVAVFDHPYFAVTGEDGSFKLANVPTGKYTLEAWHEVFGLLHSDEVNLTPGETKTIDFTFEPKPANP